jgi:CARDB
VPPRGGRRSGVDERTIRMRQAVAAAALLVVLILIVIGVHGCTVSASNDAVRSYSDNVNSLMQSSNQTGQEFFRRLSSGTGSSNPTNLVSEIDATRISADNQLSRAEGLSTPGQLAQAQQALVWVLRLRRDAISVVAAQLQPALQSSTASAAVSEIAGEMGQLYASDVLYKNYVLPMIESAVSKAGFTVGNSNGLPVNTGQFVPSLSWLTASYVAFELHTTLPANTSRQPAAPGVHGHELDACSVGGTTLSTIGSTTLPSGSAPSLTCTVTNDGQDTETNVVVKATIGGTSISGQGLIQQTQSGQTYTVQIGLSAAPPAGTYSLKVTVEPVPGEKTFTHNTKVFPVTFG